MAEIKKIRVDGTDYDVRDTSKVPVNQGTANAGKIMQVSADGILAPTAALDGKVDNTQTVNGKALNANINLNANDIPYDDDPEAQRIVGSVGSALFQRPQYNQVVRVDGEQSLTDAQKATGRDNIDAASVGEVSDLKSALGESTKNLLAAQVKTATAVNVPITSDGKGRFILNGTANSNGGRTTNVSGLFTLQAGTYTLSAKTTATLQLCTVWLNKSNNVDIIGITPNGTPSTFTLAEDTSIYVGFGLGNGKSYVATVEVQIEVGSTATDFVPSVSAYDYFARKTANTNSDRIEAIETNFSNGIRIEQIAFTKNTDNIFDAKFKPNIRIDSSGNIVAEVSSYISAEEEYIPVQASTAYCFYEREKINYTGYFNIVVSFYQSNKSFISQTQITNSGYIQFTTPANTAYVRFYLYKNNVADYLDDWKFVLCEGNSPLQNYVPCKVIEYDYVEHKSSEAPSTNPLYGKTALIFGDSITDCCNITINAENETTAYSFKNPSNTYINADGNTINFSMWPKILLENKQLSEIRNYAKFGASYKDGTPSAGNERQNLSYQITVAENDITNPNGAFSTSGDFDPDIIIFALGTNDGTPNDTPTSALAKLVRDADTTINVSASLANMDRTKFCEAVLWAFLKVKSLFPMAQCFCVTPLQSANRNTIPGLLHDYLKEMAERYNYIIIDGSYTSGITRELNNASALGEYLIDGLHPNEKGQNLMARMIIKSLERNYMPLDGDGFNAN